MSLNHEEYLYFSSSSTRGTLITGVEGYFVEAPKKDKPKEFVPFCCSCCERFELHLWGRYPQVLYMGCERGICFPYKKGMCKGWISKFGPLKR